MVGGWTRLVSRQAAALTGMVILGAIALSVINVFMWLVPRPGATFCDDSGHLIKQPAVLFDRPYGDSCPLLNAFEAYLRSEENVQGSLPAQEVVFSQAPGDAVAIKGAITVGADSKLAHVVEQRLSATDVDLLASDITQLYDLSGTTTWDYPRVVRASATSLVVITVTGMTHGFPREIKMWTSSKPVHIQVSLNDLRIVGVSTDLGITAQDPHHLTTDLQYMPSVNGPTGLTISLALPGDRPEPPIDNAKSDSSRHPTALAVLGKGLTSAGKALLAAVGWIALILAARLPISLSPRRTRGLQPLVSLAGAAVAAHITLWCAVSADDTFWRLSVFDLLSKLAIPTHWSTGGYFPSTSSAVSIIALTLAAAIPWTAANRRIPTTPRRRWTASIGTGVVLISSIAAAVVANVALLRFQSEFAFQPDTSRNTVLKAAALPLMLLAILTVIAACMASLARWAQWDIRPAPLFAACSVIPLLAVGGALTAKGGWLPSILNLAIPWLTGTVLIVCIARLGWRFLPRNRSTHWTPLAIAVLIIAAVTVAAIWRRPSGYPASWWDFVTFADDAEALLGLVLLAGTLLTLRDLDDTDEALAPGQIRFHRALAMILSLITATGTFDLTTTPQLATVLAAAVMIWFAFPASQVSHATVVLAQHPDGRRDALRCTTEAGTARRALPGLRKATRDKAADGESAFLAAVAWMEKLEEASIEPEVSPAGVTTLRLSTRELAFGAGTDPAPWRRGIASARAAFVIGAPWTLLSLTGTAWHSSVTDSHPALAILAPLIPTLVAWPAFGLIFGYFFPLLRGSTGFAKALWLYAVIVIPALSEILTSANAAHWSSWTKSVLYAVEALAFAMTLGLWADATVLLQHEMRWARLADTHNFGAITAWWSTVAAALATGVAAILLAGLQPFVVSVIPQQAPNPAPSTSNSPATVGATGSSDQGTATPVPASTSPDPSTSPTEP